MRNLIIVIAILLVITGMAAAAEYWHFSLGLRGTAVVPGLDYSNALGVGVIASFGNPDSKFNTQFEADSWKVSYDYTGPLAEFAGRQFRYSGLGFGLFERYRIFNASSRFSPYVIGGFGAYFLELKRQEETQLQGLQLRSQYIHSLFTASGGVGVEGMVAPRVSAFVEGRYVGIFSTNHEDHDLIQSYLGMKYHF